MKARARALRKNQTDAEKLMWHHLRNRRLDGLKFRRQYQVGSYIVDFACLEEHLVVEVDGGQHSLQIQADEQRSSFLRSKGLIVVRFWNHQVLNETQAVLDSIHSIVNSAPSPRPSPPQTGEREEQHPHDGQYPHHEKHLNIHHKQEKQA